MRILLTIAIAMSIGAVATIANAQSLQFTGMQLGNPNSGVVSLNGNNENVYMGALTFTDGVDSIVTYCADLSSPLNGNYNSYSVGLVDQGDGSGLARAARILAASFLDATDPDKQQGLQLAIWEALYDNGSSFDYTSGHLQITSGVGVNALADAALYYAAPLPNTPSSDVLLYHALGAGGQSQIQPVPEPASVLVLSLGLIAFARRRQVKKSP